jgi:hypothetical protein
MSDKKPIHNDADPQLEKLIGFATNASQPASSGTNTV